MTTKPDLVEPLAEARQDLFSGGGRRDESPNFDGTQAAAIAKRRAALQTTFDQRLRGAKAESSRSFQYEHIL